MSPLAIGLICIAGAIAVLGVMLIVAFTARLDEPPAEPGAVDINEIRTFHVLGDSL